MSVADFRTYLGQYTFGGVQLVAADNDLLSFVELAESFDLWLDSFRLTLSFDSVRVDADWAIRDCSNGAFGVYADPPFKRLVAADANTRGNEMSPIGVRLEAAL